MFHRFYKTCKNGIVGRILYDKRGVAAVEFAIIAPLLILIYLGMVEASQAIDTNKKLDRAAYTIADLITQQTTTNKAEIGHVMELGQALLRPYNRSTAQITVAMYRKTSGATGQRVWWSGTAGAPAPAASDATAPTSLQNNDLYLKTVVDLPYSPILTYTPEMGNTIGMTDFNIKMGSTRVLVPRTAETDCTDCAK